MAGPNITPSSTPRTLSNESFHIGVDENGLGARLGPLLITAVMAKVAEVGGPRLSKRPRGQLGADLDDSKRLLKHGSIALGEAWARAVVEHTLKLTPETPDDLVRALSLDSHEALIAPCPSGLTQQCWGVDHERFSAPLELVERVRKHLLKLEADGIDIYRAKSSIVCTQQLNAAKSAGQNRFVRNLHAMESLVLALRASAERPVKAVCGKVGGIADYSRFFGPLGGHLHVVLQRERAHSAYHFPEVGELHFLQDADSKHRLVMLASMLGKYLRELLMARITHFYGATINGEVPDCSGYNDPVSNRFVLSTEALRAKRSVPSTCFEREATRA